MASGRRASKAVRALMVGLATAAIGTVLLVTGLLEGAERTTWDMRVRALARPSVATEDVVIVEIDQASLEDMDSINGLSWPWPRSLYGYMLTFFEVAGTASVTFDIILEDSERMLVDDDRVLQAAAESFGSTIYGVAMRDTERPWPDYLARPDFAVTGLPDSLRAANTYPGATFPSQDVVPRGAVVGDVQQENDEDGVFRRYSLVSFLRDQPVPTLGLAPLVATTSGTFELEYRNGTAYLNGRRVPIDRDGRVLLRYTTPETVDPETGETIPARHTSYPAFDVVIAGFTVASGGEPALDPGLFAGKHVLIGPSAAGLLDLRPNPLDPRAPGVTAHATALDNLLAGDFLRDLPVWAAILWVIALAVGGAYAATYAQRTWTEALLIAGFLALAVALAFGGYLLDLWVPMVVPMVVAFIALAAANVANYATEGAERRFIRGAFSQYLSPAVIAELEADPSKLTLGGEDRELSMFFSDIQGFTTISEGLDPRQLSGFLQHYLTELVDIIQSLGGTIDKFEGDAIIAFWNAPLDVEDHPRRAVEAALRCQKRLTEFRPLYQRDIGEVDAETGAPGIGQTIHTRVGIHTARVSVGNFGSKTRMDYTALGDGMNLASRLEGANKAFGTYTMISARVRDEIDGAYPVRELGRIAVKGRLEPITVYEPLLPEDYEARRSTLTAYDEALRLWYNNRLDEALERFTALAEQDPAAAKMVAQCHARLAEPADSRTGWTGVMTLEEK